MRILIFSDSHGSVSGMREAIERNLAIGRVDAILFLGDGWRDAMRIADEYPDIPLHAVAGNCDWGTAMIEPGSDKKLLEFDGYRILMFHGHHYFVKADLMTAAKAGISSGADAVLFGHTHQRHEERVELGGAAVRLFNPGSILRSDDGRKSFGVLEIRGGKPLFSHGFID